MIYELWIWKNQTSANRDYAKISVEDDKVLNQAFNDEGLKRFGAAWFLYCESTWADEEYRNWGITTYQNIEGRIEQARESKKAGWYRFGNMVSLLGTLEMKEGAPQKPNFPKPIYQLWISKSNPVTTANYARLTKEDQDGLWAKWQQSVDRVGACMVLYCKSAWADESRPSFGVMAYPNIEGRQSHVEDLEKLNWGQYFDAFTLLGIET
jgi:hypothetical protein